MTLASAIAQYDHGPKPDPRLDYAGLRAKRTEAYIPASQRIMGAELFYRHAAQSRVGTSMQLRVLGRLNFARAMIVDGLADDAKSCDRDLDTWDAKTLR
jgi:hypothetical protein